MFIAFESINAILADNYVLLTVILSSFLCKFILAIATLHYCFKSDSNRLFFVFPLLFLTGAMADDIWYVTALIIKNILQLKGVLPNYAVLFRIDWCLFITQYQAIALLFDYLIERRIKINVFSLVHACFNIGLTGCFMYLLIFKSHTSLNNPETIVFERMLIKIAYAYLPFLFVPVFYKVFKKIRLQAVPRILAAQLHYLSCFFIPYLFLESVNNSASYLGFLIPLFSLHKYSFFTLTTTLCTIAMFYVSKSIVGLRFFNIKKSVASNTEFAFLNRFKDILEQLGHASTFKELGNLVQMFFQMAFTVPLSKTRLYMRGIQHNTRDINFYEIGQHLAAVDQFVTKHENSNLMNEIRSAKILIRDEIDFTHFCEEKETTQELLTLLSLLNADIFIPIFERNTLSAFITVERNAQTEKLFTAKDRDEMLIFASYLCNVTTMLKYSNIDAIHRQQKQLTDELYHKHQENNQYRESIRSFLRSSNDRKTGIVFYKNRRFKIANQAAKELIGVELNAYPNHALTRALKNIVTRVEEYKSAQTGFARDIKGTKIAISGIPSIEDQTIILQIYYPEISDVIRTQLDHLKDPSAWDYVLYLETTQSGRLVNQLIPGNNETVLNIKINLLSIALAKKAACLDMSEEDLEATVQIIHAISLRQKLHSYKLTGPEANIEVGIELFGVNSLFEKVPLPGIVEGLDGIGTLFIQNIEYLSLETQKQLANLIACGYFCKMRSEQRIYTNIRIICSTTKDLAKLVENGTFLKELYNELKPTALVMPSLNTLSEQEMHELVQGYAEQWQSTEEYRNLLSLSAKDISRLIAERPLSLAELKTKVHHLLSDKSVSHDLTEVSEFNPAHSSAEPEIAHALRLGKKALKDPKIMTLLWDKFKNQNKIALLLGVNRSSVNRRCQLYDLK